MGKNKTGKYFKYAIGEIILVVIGILIALSINNWNEERKRHNEELNLLEDIKKNLKTMLVDFEIDRTFNSKDILQYSRIEYYIDNDLPYSNELDSVFGILTFWDSPYIKATAYNSLQNKGLDLIENDSLKNSIIEMYEVVLKALMDDYNAGENTLHSIIVEPFLAKYVRRLHSQSNRLARPNDFESLKDNEEFKNILSLIIRQRKRGVEVYSDAMVQMNDLIDEIENEVESRNK